MSVPYVREVEYLSPSMLHQIETDAIRFYFTNCGPEDLSRDSQGFHAAVGCAFDLYIKQAVARRCKLKLRKDTASPISLSDEIARAKAIELARDLVVQYRKSGAWDTLLEMNPHEVEVHPPRILIEGVPTKGHLDATVKLGRGRATVLDWKTKGAVDPTKPARTIRVDGKVVPAPPRVVLPTPGYKHLYQDGRDLGRHPKAGAPMEVISKRWATQGAIYSWLLRHPRNKPVRVIIDEIIVGGPVARFVADVSVEFQAEVVERLKAAWKLIQDKDVMPADVAAGGLKLARVMREERGY